MSPTTETDDILYPSTIPFICLHLACCAAIWTGVTAGALWLCLALYMIRIFAIGAGYHRYFSHRAFTTSRGFQFLLACLAQSTVQRDVVWWAAKHRHHHLHSDTEDDVHSPRHRGFFYAHLGWIFTKRHETADLTKIGDLTRYPELMWLRRFELAPAGVMAAFAYLIAGWPGLIVGFCWSTILLYHATFSINSLAHVFGAKRYVTGDDSRNNWFLALVTCGEGWHNNHHAYQTSARQGFRWWEIDVTFYVLTLMSWVGVVWHLKRPPVCVVLNQQRLGSKVIERTATELAASFDGGSLRGKRDTNRTSPCVEAGRVRTDGHDSPEVPTRNAIAERAMATLATTVSIDEIIDRAHRIICRKRTEQLPA